MYMHMQTVRVHSISKKLMYFNVICNFIPGLLYFSFTNEKETSNHRSKYSGKNKLLCVHLLASCLASSEQRSCEDSIVAVNQH